MDKKLLFLSVIHTVYLQGMESETNDNTLLLSHKNLNDSIAGASYFIIHHHEKSRNCWKFSYLEKLKIESKKCKEVHDKKQFVIVFYSPDKKAMFQETTIIPKKSKNKTKEELYKTAKTKLDPNAKQYAVSASILHIGLGSVIDLYDRDNELIMHFFGCRGVLPLSEDEKRDISKFVELTNDFAIKRIF